MDADEFWAIVDATERECQGDIETQCELLGARLAQLGAEEILAFGDRYVEASHALYTWKIWRGADIMIGDASDDTFADFRSWVISRGHTAWAAVLADADAGLAALDADDVEEVGAAELFGAQVYEAYEGKTGTAIYDAFPDRPSADFPRGDPRGPELTGDRAARRAQFPLLSARYPERSGLRRLLPFGNLKPIRFPWRD